MTQATSDSSAIQDLLAEVVSRRAAGELLTDEQVVALYPHLQPKLGNRLAALARVQRAVAAAQKAGPLDRPVPILPHEELHAPVPVLPPPQASGALPSVNGYRVLRKLSAGGQGVVYEGVHVATGRRVAIKLIPEGFGASSAHRVRFDREAEVLAKLSHPGIVGIIDRGRADDGSFFIAMDYVRGVALDEFWTHSIKRDEEGIRSLLELMIKVARAVGAAHEQQVIHRDLKPSNIRVDEWGEPHVLDFGLARLLGRDEAAPVTLTASGQIVGSLPWLCPEQLSGRKVDARGDVYALGVLLYQAITGSFPYPTWEHVAEVLKHIASSKPRPPSRMPGVVRLRHASDLDAVVLKALAKFPAQRYADAQELADELAAYLAGRRVRARAPRRRFAKFTAVTVVFAVIVAGIVLSQVRWGPQPVRVIALPAITNSLQMRLVRLPASQVIVGSPANDPDRGYNEKQHLITIAKPFYISTTEVTQAQYQQLMSTNPSKLLGPDLPVDNVTFDEAVAFCLKLSEREKRTYRLPTEEEWEYACRAGSTQAFSGTGKLDEMGWYDRNSGGRLHPVAQKQPNAWGLYDMHGNANEWCEGEGLSPQEASDLDPAERAIRRAVRGGCAVLSAAQCRAAARQSFKRSSRFPDLGFRIVMELPSSD